MGVINNANVVDTPFRRSPTKIAPKDGFGGSIPPELGTRASGRDQHAPASKQGGAGFTVNALESAASRNRRSRNN